MELNQLNTFIVVAEEKNISRAAERLYTTPSSVSAQIRALEDELGVQLFVRNSRGVEITTIGTELEIKARHTLDSARDLAQTAASAQQQLSGSVSLGLNTTLAFLRVPAILERLRAESPNVSVELRQGTSAHSMRAVRQGTLDISFIYGDVTDTALHVQPITSARLVIVAPRQWAAQVSGAGWEDMAKLPWITSDETCAFQFLIQREFAQRGLAYQRGASTEDERTRRDLVAAGLGLSLLEEGDALESAPDIIRWGDQAYSVPLSLVTLAHRRNEPLIRAVTHAILEVWHT